MHTTDTGEGTASETRTVASVVRGSQQEEAPGMVFWHPKGWTVYRTIEQYMRLRQQEVILGQPLLQGVLL